jgi:hypothetical protein
MAITLLVFSFALVLVLVLVLVFIIIFFVLVFRGFGRFSVIFGLLADI